MSRNTSPKAAKARFGVFEMDFNAGELRKNGIRVRLQDQPFRLLRLLVEEPGRVLTRERIRDELWADGTYVDFEQAISTAVNKIREALGDSASSPRFVETIPRRGLRFLAQVERLRQESPVAAPPPEGVDVSAPGPGGATRSRLPMLGLAVGALCGSIVTFWATRPRSEEVRDVVRTQFTFNASSSAGWGGGFPAVSPRGRRIAFVASGRDGIERIHIRALDNKKVEVLKGTEGAYNPFWAPDGESLGFFAQGKLKRISLSGGPAETLGDAQGGPGAAWSPSGGIVFSPGTRASLRRVTLEGGNAVAATELNSEAGENSHRWPQFLPDGRRFLYFARAAAPEDSSVYVASLDGAAPRRLLPSQSNAAFVPSSERTHGRLLFVRQGALMTQRLNLETLELQGEPQPMVGQVRYVPIRHLGLFGASADGRVVAFRAGGPEQRRLHWFGLGGKHLGSPGPAGFYDQVRLSPQGDRTALTLPDPNTGKRDVWVMRLDSGALERLTFDAANDWCPVWSPEGREIAFASDRSGVSDIYVKDSLGASEPKELHRSSEPKFPSDWSRDGAFLAFHYRQGSAIDVGLVALEESGRPVPLLTSGFAEPEAYFSPDGKWVAYVSNETGVYEVYVQSLRGEAESDDTPAEKRPISNQGGTDPRWSPDSKTLYYLAADNALMAVNLADSISPPRKLFDTCSSGLLWDGSRQSYDISPDGKRFLMSCPVEETVSSEITVLTGW